MTTIITRELGVNPKPTPLTNEEMDQNFINLNEDKAEKSIVDSIEKAVTGRVIINTWDLNSHVLIQSTEARCAVLDLKPGTGGTAITAAGQVICPATSKVYVVSNNTGYLITFKTASGTGVDISDATSMLLVCDGTNVITGVTQSASASATGAPIGAIQYFAGTTSTSYPGASWLKCDGSIVSQASYPDLYSAVGNIADGFNNLTNQYVNVFATSSGIPIWQTEYFGGQFVSVGDSGYIGTSTDGITWTTRTSNTSSNLYGVTYDGLKYYVCGSPAFVASSTDAITWSTTTISGISNPIMTILYQSGKFIAGTSSSTAFTPITTSSLGITGAIYTSTDAVTWTLAASTTGGTYKLSYANSLYFCSTGNPSAGVVGYAYSSTDAVTWTQRISLNNGVTMTPVQYIGSKYICGQYTSTDGTTWAVNSIPFGANTNVAAKTIGSKYYVGTTAGGFYSTTNGTTWSTGNSGVSTGIYTLAYNGSNTYIYAGAGSVVRTSTDAVTWNSFSLLWGASNGTTGVSGGTSGAIASTTNGTTWTNRSSGTAYNINDVKYLNGKFWYVGNTGALGNSTDGITWTTVTSGTTSTIYSITYGGGMYVYGTGNGYVGTSTNGVSWTLKNVNTTTAINVVSYFNSQYLAYGNNGVGRTSTDAVTWTATNMAFHNPISSASNNGVFVVYNGSATVSGQLWVTENGDDWDMVIPTPPGASNPNVGPSPTNIVVVGDYFVACSVNANQPMTASTNLTNVWVSKNGKEWYAIPKQYYSQFTSAFLLGTKIVLTGTDLIGTANLYSYNTASDFALPDAVYLADPINVPRTAYIKAL